MKNYDGMQKSPKVRINSKKVFVFVGARRIIKENNGKARNLL